MGSVRIRFAVLALGMSLALVVGKGAASSAEPATNAVAEAAAAIASLKKALGGALRGALADGPESAIGVCQTEAPRLTEASSSAGLRVGRTSNRLRNPDNAPEAWMLPLLEEFRDAEPRPGSSRTVDLGPLGIGYVEPIYLQPLCSVCHGENVDPGLLEHIRAQYPKDEAVGFRVGEFRGLFWAVVRPEADTPAH